MDKPFGMDVGNGTKWDAFKFWVEIFFSPAQQRKSGWFGREYIADVRTCDAKLADIMQRIDDGYIEMYAYVNAKKNDNKDVI
jgi:hypothetical protein